VRKYDRSFAIAEILIYIELGVQYGLISTLSSESITKLIRGDEEGFDMATSHEYEEPKNSLHQNPILLHALLATSADMITVSDRYGNITYASPATERVSGYTVAEFMARHPFDTIHPDDRPTCEDAFAQLIGSHGLRLDLQHRVLHKDGTWRWVEGTFTNLFDDPDVRGLVATIRDITARKQAEDALSESEAQYRTLFASIDEGFCIIEMLFDDADKPVDYRFLQVNPWFEEMTGLVRPVGKTAREMVLNLEDFWVETYGKVALTGEAVRFEQQSEAMNRWFEVYTSRFGRPSSRQVAIVFKDITKRKLAEQALRESENRFRNMADNAPMMVWVTEENGSCTYLSQSWYTFTGQTPETGLGFGWLNAVHPDDRDRSEHAFHTANEQRQPFRVEYRLRRYDGEYRWTIDSAQPRLGDDDEYLGYIGSVIDITERKQAEAELERLYAAEQAARAEAEAAVQIRDQFLSIASHELRNPLTSLLGYADLLNRNIERQSVDARTKNAAERVVQQAQRLNGMIEHLLDVSRLQQGQFQVRLRPFELTAHVEHVVDRFRMSLAPEEQMHRIVLLQPHEELQILGDVPRLEEVLVNLLSNAVKYSAPGQPVEVRVVQQATEVIVEVVDQGIGIPAESLDHLFMPFYRAHNVSFQTSGFGIGLYVVREIVQRHGGHIEVESTVGTGSTFRVVLPLHVPTS